MRTILCAFMFMMAVVNGMFSQNVGINADGSAPDNSAMLDVKSSSKGMLPPRMSLAERNNIACPVNGLMVFCTDCCDNGSICVFTSSGWMSVPFSYIPPVARIHSGTGTQIVWNWNAVLFSHPSI